MAECKAKRNLQFCAVLAEALANDLQHFAQPVDFGFVLTEEQGEFIHTLDHLRTARQLNTTHRNPQLVLFPRPFTPVAAIAAQFMAVASNMLPV
jgi:hypothetical protein